MENESETFLLSKNYIITGGKFVFLDDCHDSPGSNCDSASAEQIKVTTINLISCFCWCKDK